MKFDWDIARELLQRIEDSPRSHGEFDFSALGLEDEVLQYHLGLMSSRMLINSQEVFALGDDYPTFIVTSMTLEGHELLEIMRSDTMWGNIKAAVKEKGLGMTFDAIKAAGLWLIHRTFS